VQMWLLLQMKACTHNTTKLKYMMIVCVSQYHTFDLEAQFGKHSGLLTFQLCKVKICS